MNLNFSIKAICSIVGANIIENSEIPPVSKIKNIVVDSRSPSISNQTLFVALQGTKQHGNAYVTSFVENGGIVVLTDIKINAISCHQIIVESPLIALQKIAQAHREKFHIPIVGITGSNGKTIVKEWLYHVLKDEFSIVRSPKSYNSQIGVPLSVLEITEEHNLGIFEAGISQPGEMEQLVDIIQPTIGVFTGIGDAHSANFESEEQKMEEKQLLFKNVEKLIQPEEIDVSITIPFKDEASNINAGLVKRASEYLQIDKKTIEKNLSDLPVISMRLEQLEGKNNCVLLNDAYSSDLVSLEIALKHLNTIARDKKRVLIFTDFEENNSDNDQKQLNDLLKIQTLDKIVFIGNRKDFELEVEYYSTVAEYLKQVPSYKDAVILFKGSRKSALEKVVQYFTGKKHITRLTINFHALRNNLKYFRSLIHDTTKVLVMVKAQSYGSGLTEMATFLENEGIDFFGVAYADEGVAIRNVGVKKPILVMNPEESAFDDIIDYNLEPSIYSIEILNAFIHHLILRQKYRYPIHIKIDTGMNRLGFVDKEIEELCNIIQTQPEIVVASVFSHLSVADDSRENEFTYGQIRKFEVITGNIKDKIGYGFDRHLANSAGTINYHRAHFDMVRVGIGIFGLLEENNPNLEPVLTLTSRISQIKWIEEGDSVGYGRSFIAGSKTKIGIIPVGYADGLQRRLGQGKWSILVNGEKARIVGNICMDMCMVDLTNIAAKSGDDVEIFGENNSIFAMSDVLDTIPYEIISGISSRVHRIYIEE